MSAVVTNVPIPSLQQLVDNNQHFLQRAFQAVEAAGSIDAATAQLQRENNQVLAFVEAVGIHGAYQYLQNIARQAIPINARGQFLIDWLKTYGMGIKPANVAEGNADFTGTPDTTIDQGTRLQITVKGQLLYFKTKASVTIDAEGKATVAIVAEAGGVAGNLAAGSVLTLVNPIPGVNSSAAVDTDGLQRGTEKETELQALARLLHRLANPPRAGSPGDYERWALEVAGVTRAWGLRNPNGPCTAGVVIMADGNGSNGIPTIADQQAVFDHIRDPYRGPCDDLYVILPQAKMQNLSLTISPDTPEVRQAVDTELRDLFLREAEPKIAMPHTHLTEAASIAAGEVTHEFTSPVLQPGGQIAVDANLYEVLVLGNVNFVEPS